MESSAPRAAIVGIAGAVLASDEDVLLRAHPPAGVILFRRNVEDPAQLGALAAALRRALPRDAVLMVDQEGGRVARLRPPHFGGHPPAGDIGKLFGRDRAKGLRAAWLTGAMIGWECAAHGLDTVCAPVLDLRLPAASEVVGDRAYDADPQVVAQLGRAIAAGLLAAGVQPVGKHAPGHGRARVDSHFELPEVTADDVLPDLLPFAANADLPWLMTAHIRYRAWDATLPATLSPRVIAEVIRGRIGFRGVLVTDDLAMEALSGTPAERACAALAAGCDVALYCPGDATGNAAVLRAVPELTVAARSRLAAARGLALRRRLALDPALLAAERDGLGI